MNDQYALSNIIKDIANLDVAITLLSTTDAEKYIRVHSSNFGNIKTLFFTFDNKKFTVYVNIYSKEVVITGHEIELYELKEFDDFYFIKSKVKEAIKETYLDSVTDPKSLIAFSKMLKIELQEGIDRAVAKFLETIKYD